MLSLETELATIVSLNSVALPHPYRRNTVPRRIPAALGVAFERCYDFETLFYDVFFDPHSSRLIVLCPKLLNFRQLIRGGNVFVDGEQCDFCVESHGRYDLLWLNVSYVPSTFSVALDGRLFSSGVSSSGSDLFAGKRVLLTLSKNNRLDWIADWVKHHVAAHGANAVLLFDNDSDLYSAQDVAGVMARISGLECFRVVSAPFRFGPHSSTAFG